MTERNDPMNGQKKKYPKRKALGIVLDVLTYLFFAVCIFALITSVLAKKSGDGAFSFMGGQMRVVTSESMEAHPATDVSGYDVKDIPIKSLVFIEEVPKDPAEADLWYASLKKGDVLTFQYVYTAQVTITHRIVEDPVKDSNGGYTITLEGDNKGSNADTLRQVIHTGDALSPNYVIGKVTGQSYPLGLLITAVKSPVGIVCIVIIPAAVIMIFEIMRLYNALTEKKKMEHREAQQRRDAEFEEMKRQLELLQKQSGMAPTEEPPSTPQDPPSGEGE